MKKYFNTHLERLRFLGLLEGISLLLLVFIAVPLKYLFKEPLLVELIGPVHGVLFVLFVLNTFIVAIQQKWKFFGTTLKVLIASFIPFGTFYIDKHIFSKIDTTA